MIEFVKTIQQRRAFLGLFLRYDGYDRILSFMPGKPGRQDYFAVKQTFLGSKRPEPLAEINAEAEATLAMLEELDAATAADSRIVCHEPGIFDSTAGRYYGALWGRIANKDPKEEQHATAALYRKRQAEQELVFSGKLKRGHRAFGFLPLDGGR